MTNAILLPFAPLVAGFLWIRRQASRKLALALAIAALAMPLAWSVRNLQLPAGPSSSGRALTNLVQGSWPEYHAGYLAAVMGNPEGRRIMQAIDHETSVMLADPRAGLGLVVQRMASAPLHYLAWYLSKPALLWDWSIRMGQGDIYVYATFDSPLDENPVMRAWVALCHALNPLLMLLAFAGMVLAVARGFSDRASGAAIGQVAAVFGIYVTLLYSALQAEPRYAIPFRGFEIALATYGLRCLVGWVAVRRALAPSNLPA